ncbi:hypothetical protein PoB_005859000 [Plakobranchus ocellatus]|uniref:Uncharacterized protein n=1 Tax=Plakobranchus ocellatus TaxID=259542 RepID=A0AAV4CKE9_9GAST|nr:hypothetical protein PoB_005859000 [Plakobranchus ocellatus]
MPGGGDVRERQKGGRVRKDGGCEEVKMWGDGERQKGGKISIFWSPFGSATYSPYIFQADFALNCATPMPRFFKESALLEDSVGGIRTWEPQSENTASQCARSSHPRVDL